MYSSVDYGAVRARLSYLKMEAVLWKREIERARENIERDQVLLAETEDKLDAVQTAIQNFEELLEESRSIS